MKKIILALVFVILLSGCVIKIEKSVEQVENTKLANPASENCLEKGGSLRMVENEQGQYGICTLPDGTECEEWEYFRGNCPKE